MVSLKNILLLGLLIYIIFLTERGYRSLGCWKDELTIRAIPLVEGAKGFLEDDPFQRVGPIEKCFDLAMNRRLDIFALQNGGECLMGAAARGTYKRYGPSDDCLSNGEGGPLANQVYEIENGEFEMCS